MLETRDGVEKNHNQAAFWYQKAANQGFADAQYRLASILPSNEINKHKAQLWFLKAAKQGHAVAQNAKRFLETLK